MKHVALLLLFSVFCFGCSRQNVHVVGTVTYEDGSPVESGSVTFATETHQFNGDILDGAYDVGAEQQGEGVLPGTYKVWFSISNAARVETIMTSTAAGEKIAFPQLTGEFTQPDKSPLTLEVRRGSRRIAYDIVVKRHSNVHVSGKVTYEDGSPVKSGSVKFETESHQFNGVIRNGVYDAGVEQQGEGIPPGTYKVWLANTARIETMITSSGSPVATDDKVAFPQLTEEFTQPDKSPLSLEVKRGSERIIYDIVVKQHPDWNKQQKYQLKEGGQAER